ncbi:beta strand repeat-containing protein [Streptomyces sp. 8N706]|uniref:beta strand repeat-containing protein n=1 Tax=Streptomyces sp. 8N706 TaxID=3457416 RepID=UPI003FD51272
MAAPTLTLVASAPASSVFGQQVTFTATVISVLPGMGTPTGTVTFVISGSGGGTYTVPLNASGKAIVTATALSTGTHSVTATYNGSARFTRSSGNFQHAVLKASTRTAVSSSPNPSARGQAVTFTATVRAVAPGAGTPTGTVVFVIDALPAISAQLDANGVATVSVNVLGTGTHSVSAIYRGDISFLPSTGSGTHTVAPAQKPTTTTVTTSPDPSVFGQPVALTAVVAPAPPGTGLPTGIVTFTVDGQGGGTFTAPLDSSGTATVTVDTLGTGSHSVTAAYGGDAGFASSSGADTHTVDQADTTTAVSSAPDPSVFGQDVTFTAVVAPVPPGAGAPSGVVTFTVDGGGTFTVPLEADGTATVTLGTPPVGEVTVTATYGGDAVFASSSSADTHTVDQADTTTTVSSSPDPSAVGQAVTFTATVAPVPPGAGTPNGIVVFSISGGPTLTGTLVDGVATVTDSTLSTGSYFVIATYEGDAGFGPSTGTDTHTVAGASTTTTVTSSPDPSVFGQQVTFTAVVSPVAPATGTPTGTVTFDFGGTSVTAPLDATGVATVTENALPAGSYSVIATYNGDTDYVSSTGTDTHVVERASTTTTVTSTPDPSVFGQVVTFTAVVTPVAPGAGVPTGTVTLTESGGGTITLPLDSNGVASVTSNALAVRTYSGTATYSGDANYAPSAGSDTHVVEPAATTTAVTSSPDPSVFGQDVTFTATVTPVAPGAGTPAGQVTFTIDGTTTLTGTLAGGVATVTYSVLAAGSHTVVATYVGAGDSRFTSSSGADTHTVNQAATTTTVTSSPDPSVFGQPVVFTAAVAPVPPGAGTPTGTVTFTISGGGGTTTVPVDTDGTATLTRTSLPSGSHSVTATYNGDTNYNPSAGTDTHTVNQAATTTTVTSSPDPSALGQTVTIRATVDAELAVTGTPSGTVTFVISGSGGGTFTEALDTNGTAQLDITTLDLGPHTITATYNGSTDFLTSTDTTTHTVEVEPSSNTTVTTTPDPSVFGQNVTVTAAVTPAGPGPLPTGTITFTISGTGGGTFTVPLTDATATLTLDTLSVTTHAINATYNGDTNYNPSTGADTHTVNPAATTTTVTSTPDPSAFGQDVTFTAAVAAVPPGAGTPTGQVTFTIDGTTTLTGTLDATGTATVTHNTLTAGSHTIEATYVGAGDASFTSSTGTDTHTVNQASTTTTVTSTPDPSAFGQPITITAAIAPLAPGAGTPTGTVTFTISGGGGTTTIPVDTDGTATLTLNTLPSGSYTVTATYNGDSDFAASTGTDTHAVNQASTSTTLSGTPDPSVFGQSVTFTATVAAVAPGAGTPTGTVTFTISGGPTLTGALDASGVASVSTSTLPAGNYSITATYNGDTNYTPSAGTDTHTVNRAPTSSTVTSTPDPSVFGQPVTFTAVVASSVPGAGTPTGTVTFFFDGGSPVTASLVGGVATVTRSNLSVGPHTVMANYSGASNFAASSGTDTHTVNRAASTTVTVSSPDPSQPGNVVTFTATVTATPPGAGTPTGTVTFVIGGPGGGTFTAALVNGVAIVTNQGLSIGSHAITATYNGNAQFAPSTGTDTHTVTT